jgi:two-component system response regulator AtoC
MMNILLVDDEQDSRTFMAEFLEGLGHEVTEKADGQEALNAFASDSFHLVLTDIKMPRMSGLELLHNIRHLPGGTEVNVVVFTAYGDLHTSVQALRAGAYDYLLKPINIDELVHLTERIAEHQALQRQNHFLTNKFDNVVEAAVSETKHELSRLQQAYLTNQGLGQIGIFSPALRKIFDQAAKLHPNRSIPVLIEGETGTGKDLVARYLHYGQGECTEPFIALNCAALTPSLFESELFGYEGGAFTGSQPRGRKGKLDMAQGGTLFLDEISEMPVNLQAKLLRVIQEKAFYRVGGLKKVPLDVRFICATNQDITAMVEKGTFRQDLYYRLNVARIQLPPLRERREEIIPLAHMFLGEFFQSEARSVPVIGSEAGEILQNYEWPGNVRELRNVMEYAALIWDDELELQPHHLKLLERSKPIRVSDASDHPSWLDHQNFTLPPGSLPLKELTDNIIRQALKMHQGNKTATARYLGISRRSLYSRLKHISDQD